MLSPLSIGRRGVPKLVSPSPVTRAWSECQQLRVSTYCSYSLNKISLIMRHFLVGFGSIEGSKLLPFSNESMSGRPQDNKISASVDVVELTYQSHKLVVCR